MSDDKESAILHVAEEMVRQGGYNGFSFRNIATAIGIKSSSVHYHFATKEDLGAAVARHYTDKFIGALDIPEALVESGQNPIEVYINAFRTALSEDKGMCLCGMFAAEAQVLPERVTNETRLFFTRNTDWLKSAYKALGHKKEVAHEKAVQTISLLEGAMITSNIMGDLSTFEVAVKLINLTQ